MPDGSEVSISLIQRMMNFKDITKNARKKLEVTAAPVMSCKRTKSKHGVTRSKNDDHKKKLACISEADESKRMRMEGITPRIHKDHIAGQRCQFTASLQFFTQFNSDASSDANTGSKRSSGQKMKKT